MLHSIRKRLFYVCNRCTIELQGRCYGQFDRCRRNYVQISVDRSKPLIRVVRAHDVVIDILAERICCRGSITIRDNNRHQARVVSRRDYDRTSYTIDFVRPPGVIGNRSGGQSTEYALCKRHLPLYPFLRSSPHCSYRSLHHHLNLPR